MIETVYNLLDTFSGMMLTVL